MEFEGRKKLDKWTLKNMKGIFEDLKAVRELPEYKELMKAGNKIIGFHNNLSYSNFDSFIEVCDTLLERMAKESERVKKQKKPRRW